MYSLGRNIFLPFDQNPTNSNSTIPTKRINIIRKRGTKKNVLFLQDATLLAAFKNIPCTLALVQFLKIEITINTSKTIMKIVIIVLNDC